MRTSQIIVALRIAGYGLLLYLLQVNLAEFGDVGRYSMSAAYKG